ncbi:Hypothetical predicted protein [Octopus vulgaris]|uniref:Uncharacterized protein n=1 Tax=Octopus vulgaris TaxID=6645 RepID=A0AA36BWM8_OCTVU|nr:Hypothetical predicted protein [Octopus vulgaris]
MWKYFTALLIILSFKIEDVANQEKLPKPGSNPDQGKADNAPNKNAADASNPKPGSNPDQGKPDNAPADPISAPLG